MPVDTMGVALTEGTSFRRALEQETSRTIAARLSPPERVRRAVRSETTALTTPCGESERCLARIGQQIPADLVLLTTLAGLGDMRLVRARLVRARDGLVVQDLQETVPGGPRVLDQTASDLVRRLFPERGAKPWYRRWWVWTAAAGVVAATVGITWGLAARQGEPEQDPNVIHVGELP